MVTSYGGVASACVELIQEPARLAERVADHVGSCAGERIKRAKPHATIAAEAPHGRKSAIWSLASADFRGAAGSHRRAVEEACWQADRFGPGARISSTEVG
jgi:hypothetical protein